MPRLYLDVSSFLSHPAALAFPTQISQMQANSGAIDRLLSRASARVDSFSRKRIQAPQSTTVGTGGIATAGTVLPVTSTLGYDNKDEQAVIIGTGGTQEVIAIKSGGVAVTSWTSPYPGSITLAAPTVFAHSAGETVQGCYQEVSTVGSSASDDAWSDSLMVLDQAAQVAQAHSPHMTLNALTRVLFLKCYPIIQLISLEHMLSFTVSYGIMTDVASVGIEPAAGYLRLLPGSFVTPQGLLRATYIAGYMSVPDEIGQAAAWYAADELQTMISQGAYDSQQGKRRNRWGEPTQGKSQYVQRAEDAITDSGLKRLT